MENLEQILLLLISGQGLLLSFALLGSVFKKKYGSFFFGIIVLVITIEVFTNWLITIDYTNQSNAIPFWILGSYLLIPPALWSFLKSITDVNFRFSRRIWWLFVPALIEITVELLGFYAYRFFDVNFHLIKYSFWYHATETLPIVLMIVILVVFYKKLFEIYHKLKKLKVDKPIQAIFKLHIFLGVFSLLTLLWVAIGIFEFQIFYYIQLFLLAFIFVFGYLSYFQPTLFETPKVLHSRFFEQGDPLHNDTVELQRLKELFENEHIYLEHKLSLKSVASQLKLPQQYVSGLINSYYNTNFNAFVNSYRVKEVQKRINDPEEKNKTLLAIALESGFSSKSSFNKTFKEVAGKSPSEFLKNTHK